MRIHKAENRSQKPVPHVILRFHQPKYGETLVEPLVYFLHSLSILYIKLVQTFTKACANFNQSLCKL